MTSFVAYHATITRLSNWFHLYFLLICCIDILLSFKIKSELLSLMLPTRILSGPRRFSRQFTGPGVGQRKLFMDGTLLQVESCAISINIEGERIIFKSCLNIFARYGMQVFEKCGLREKNISRPGFSCTCAVSAYTMEYKTGCMDNNINRLLKYENNYSIKTKSRGK